MAPGRPEEGVEVLLDHAVQHGVLGAAWPVVAGAEGHSGDIDSARERRQCPEMDTPQPWGSRRGGQLPLGCRPRPHIPPAAHQAAATPALCSPRYRPRDGHVYAVLGYRLGVSRRVLLPVICSWAGPGGGVSRLVLEAPGSCFVLAGGAPFACTEPESPGLRPASDGRAGVTVAGSPGGWARGGSAVTVWSDVWTRRRSIAHRPAPMTAVPAATTPAPATRPSRTAG
jgi:hypothetical protein